MGRTSLLYILACAGTGIGSRPGRVIGGHPNYAEPADVPKGQVCGRLGWAEPQHLLVCVGHGVGDITD